MKKVLVVNGHPYAESYCSALYQAVLENIDTGRCEVRAIDLGTLKFDPVLRMGYRHRMPEDEEISYSQESVKWAEHIIFIYPIWFHSLPSLFKGWIDRVFAPKFAYNMHGIFVEKHLKGRSCHLIMTGDSPTLYNRLIPNSPIRLMKLHIMGMFGIKTTRVSILGHASLKDNQQGRERFLARVAKIVGKL
ncbi:MAG: NAD(P)H-dependent oxidoreductase [Coriobacteriales bacterium]|jgi:putative NADPH-quinone reductase|nr:NAD(P)H-dependent oxidoreductase [Coriobacteriales bacterium]